MNLSRIVILSLLCLTTPQLSAEGIPAVDISVTGGASPELLADFRQALKRAASRQPATGSGEATGPEITPERVDLDQFWKVDRNVPYTNSNNPRQRLDILYPFEGEPPYRTVVNFHRGGPTDRRDTASNAAVFRIIYQGYALVTVDYRPPEEALWPAQLYDAKAAIRFIRANANQHELDADSLVAWGSSAGAHLALMLAATNGDSGAEDPEMGQPASSSEVQGVVSWAGISDITTLAPLGQPLADSLMGYPAYESDLALEASPVEHITPAYPPVLLVHGTHDEVVPFEQSARMALRVNAITGEPRARLKLLINVGHDGDWSRSPDNLVDVLDFVDSILFPETGNPNRSTFFPPIQTRPAE
ncbi:Prolyl oligopeptidase family protein [Marinobacter daqiaonensis]|uniref:Prolyl oligopeptidase family protein n=1 Tax=Marinobacter daqiaonensis TaxID=650891 RepID=A0A1I6HTG8_9GAMM|nr:alpha/beta hydrolase [Marinobacter daqiaonensis]SFR57723.1 Prolyl oligopeptidase family protein [Marinobacter daqiaonensis]